MRLEKKEGKKGDANSAGKIEREPAFQPDARCNIGLLGGIRSDYKLSVLHPSKSLFRNKAAFKVERDISARVECTRNKCGRALPKINLLRTSVGK